MTDTQSRRRALLSLLDQFPLERDLYLYEGRREVSPRDEFADKIEALFMPETNASITTPEGQRDYYRDLVAEVSDENKRLARDLAEYEAYDALPSVFQQVMEASADYVINRFKGELTQDGTITKFTEESDEFYEAATDYAAYRNDYDAKIHKQKMLGECFDVMVTMGGVLSCFGVTFDDVEQAMRAGLDKLDNRTEADYVWDEKSKTVIKRSKLEAQS